MMPEPLVLLLEASSYKLRPITTCGFEVVSGNLVSKNVERHLDESSNYWKERYVHLGARLLCIDMHVIRSNQYVPVWIEAEGNREIGRTDTIFPGYSQ